jgi:hypothetical protein
MLPAYIIEEILRQERKKNRSTKEIFVEYPLIDDDFDSHPDGNEPDDCEDDGIAIIDFVI